VSGGGIMFAGPVAVRLYQLKAVHPMIRLEGKGLRFRGGSVKAKWAKHFGMRPRVDRDAVLAALDAAILELEGQTQATEDEQGHITISMRGEE
jgi:hypothetical protein